MSEYNKIPSIFLTCVGVRARVVPAEPVQRRLLPLLPCRRPHPPQRQAACHRQRRQRARQQGSRQLLHSGRGGGGGGIGRGSPRRWSHFGRRQELKNRDSIQLEYFEINASMFNVRILAFYTTCTIVHSIRCHALVLLLLECSLIKRWAAECLIQQVHTERKLFHVCQGQTAGFLTAKSMRQKGKTFLPATVRKKLKTALIF